VFPPFVGVAVKVIAVPLQILLFVAFDDILALTIKIALTVALTAVLAAETQPVVVFLASA
jgi:energy-converting hydrogenase Eha subunit E